jgi:hypothetical protein
VAVQTESRLDAQALRSDFAVFDELVNGKPVAYLDSASSTQKPRQVLDAMREFYEHSYANVHRGVYTLAERATAGYEGAREKVRAYVNAPSNREVIFTRSATEALNLIAYSWGLENLGPGDVVVITELEHHANFVPWQFVAKRTPSARSTRSRSSRRGRTSKARSWSSTLPRRRRIGGSTCRRLAATSSRSRRTSCVARAASVRSGDGASCSSRCSRSTSAAR